MVMEHSVAPYPYHDPLLFPRCSLLVDAVWVLVKVASKAMCGESVPELGALHVESQCSTNHVAETSSLLVCVSWKGTFNPHIPMSVHERPGRKSLAVQGHARDSEDARTREREAAESMQSIGQCGLFRRAKSRSELLRPLLAGRARAQSGEHGGWMFLAGISTTALACQDSVCERKGSGRSVRDEDVVRCSSLTFGWHFAVYGGLGRNSLDRPEWVID